MKQRVAKVATACFYHLRRLRQIRRRIGEEVTTRLVLALVIPRLDYCNSLLAGIPLCTTEALQRVQNVAARLIFDLGQGSSSASGPSLTPARPRGTHCSAIYAIQSTLIVFRNLLKDGTRQNAERSGSVDQIAFGQFQSCD